MNAAKKEITLYDYVDPILAKMHSKRRAGYKALGYEIETPQKNQTLQLPMKMT